jgi:hypothetical protein
MRIILSVACALAFTGCKKKDAGIQGPGPILFQNGGGVGGGGPLQNQKFDDFDQIHVAMLKEWEDIIANMNADGNWKEGLEKHKKNMQRAASLVRQKFPERREEIDKILKENLDRLEDLRRNGGGDPPPESPKKDNFEHDLIAEIQELKRKFEKDLKRLGNPDEFDDLVGRFGGIRDAVEEKLKAQYPRAQLDIIREMIAFENWMNGKRPPPRRPVEKLDDVVERESGSIMDRFLRVHGNAELKDVGRLVDQYKKELDDLANRLALQFPGKLMEINQLLQVKKFAIENYRPKNKELIDDEVLQLNVKFHAEINGAFADERKAEIVERFKREFDALAIRLKGKFPANHWEVDEQIRQRKNNLEFSKPVFSIFARAKIDELINGWRENVDRFNVQIIRQGEIDRYKRKLDDLERKMAQWFPEKGAEFQVMIGKIKRDMDAVLAQGGQQPLPPVRVLPLEEIRKEIRESRTKFDDEIGMLFNHERKAEKVEKFKKDVKKLGDQLKIRFPGNALEINEAVAAEIRRADIFKPVLGLCIDDAIRDATLGWKADVLGFIGQAARRRELDRQKGKLDAVEQRITALYPEGEAVVKDRIKAKKAEMDAFVPEPNFDQVFEQEINRAMSEWKRALRLAVVGDEQKVTDRHKIKLDEVKGRMDAQFPDRAADTRRRIESARNKMVIPKKPIIVQPPPFRPPPPPAGGAFVITPQMAANAKQYIDRVAACEAEERARASLKGMAGLKCEPTQGSMIGLFGKGLVAVGKTLKNGAFGRAFDLPSANAIMKVALNGADTFCREKNGLALINGLSGFAPRVFDITSGVDRRCGPRTVAMEKVGDSDWADVVRTVDKGFYLRFAKLFEIVKLLHAQGFVHHDIHGGNIRVKQADPNFVALIDFGLMHPYIDDNGQLLSNFHTRSSDAQRFIFTITFTQGANAQPWFADFTRDMNAVKKPTDEVPFDKWIALFRNEANKL